MENKLIRLQNFVNDLNERFNSDPENRRILEEDLSWENLFYTESPEEVPEIKRLIDSFPDLDEKNRKSYSMSIWNDPMYRSSTNDLYKSRRGAEFEKKVAKDKLSSWINKNRGIVRVERIKNEDEMVEFKKILLEKKIPGLIPQQETDWMGSAADWMIILPSGEEIPICCSTKLWGGGGQGDRANLYFNLKKSYPCKIFLLLVCEFPPKIPRSSKSTHDKLESLYFLNEEICWISDLEKKLDFFIMSDLKHLYAKTA